MGRTLKDSNLKGRTIDFVQPFISLHCPDYKVLGYPKLLGKCGTFSLLDTVPDKFTKKY